MSDRSQELHQTLTRLHEQLEELPDLDESVRDELRAAAAEIREALEGDSQGSLPALLDRLQEALQRSEGSHPTLTAITGRVFDALAKIGI
jgi:hypothetical protein